MQARDSVAGAVRRRLPGAAAIYALASIAAAVASVAGVILLTRLLAAQGYGLYAAIVGLVMIIQNAGYLALQTSIIRFHARAGGAEGERRLATAVRIAFVVATGAAALVWTVAVDWLGNAGVTPDLELAGLALLVLRGWLSLVQAWNRAERRSWTYLLLEVVQSVGTLLLAVLALRFVPGSAAAALWGAAAATGLAAILAPRLLWSPIRVSGTRPLLRDLLGYGAPLTLVFLASAALAVSDRLLIAVHVGAAAAGAYAVAFAIADRAMSLVLLPVPIAAKPILFAAWEDGGEAAARPILERSAKWLIALGFPAATLLVFAPEPIARLLAGGGLAEEASRAVPLLAIGALLSGLLAHHFALAFQLTRHTHRMLAAMGIPAALNLAANLFLIPRFGMLAAAWTTVASYGLALALTIILGRRDLAIPFPLKYTSKVCCWCVPLAALAAVAT
jgi:O-antigen/teichoic acid export membrane protein